MKKFAVLFSFLALLFTITVTQDSNAQNVPPDWPQVLVVTGPGTASDANAPPGPGYRYSPPDDPVVDGKPYTVTDANGNTTVYVGRGGRLVKAPPPPEAHAERFR